MVSQPNYLCPLVPSILLLSLKMITLWVIWIFFLTFVTLTSFPPKLNKLKLLFVSPITHISWKLILPPFRGSSSCLLSLTCIDPSTCLSEERGKQNIKFSLVFANMQLNHVHILCILITNWMPAENPSPIPSQLKTHQCKPVFTVPD